AACESVVMNIGGDLRCTLFQSPLFEDHENRHDDHCKPREVVPLERLFQIQHREDRKHAERNHFLDSLQLCCRELIGANAVRRHLKTILRKSDKPADNDYFEKRGVSVLQMAVPSESHENIGEGKQQDCGHDYYAARSSAPCQCSLTSGNSFRYNRLVDTRWAYLRDSYSKGNVRNGKSFFCAETRPSDRNPHTA